MAQNEEFDWSPKIPFKIHEKDYAGYLKRLIKVLGKNTQTKFIKRGPQNIPYVTIMLETDDSDRALDVHMRHDNLYVDAMGRRGDYPIFTFDGVKNFGDGSKELGFGEGYNSMTRNLEDSEIYKLNYNDFVQAVETLIEDMSKSKSKKDLGKLVTKKWMRRMFIIISVISEGARNRVVSLSYNETIESLVPTTTPWMWIKLMFNSWESLSNAAIGFEDDIKIADLTKEEKDMLFGKNVPPTAKDLEKNLNAVLASSRLCRAALDILCGHTKPAKSLQASSSRSN